MEICIGDKCFYFLSHLGDPYSGILKHVGINRAEKVFGQYFHWFQNKNKKN